MTVGWLLAIFLTPLAYSALLKLTCVALSGRRPDRRLDGFVVPDRKDGYER